jgi:hypothetical protein
LRNGEKRIIRKLTKPINVGRGRIQESEAFTADESDKVFGVDYL